uniref:Pectate lyase n=1 Tax=Physcomitrium patens TaxID=3218 RepID=A0A2K1IU68_PHYPA|nr:hypothetical protein PHYPA_024762 [Physcomitrium patens]
MELDHANKMSLLSVGVLVLLLSGVRGSADETDTELDPRSNPEIQHTMTALANITDILELVASEGGVIADDCERQIQTANETLHWLTDQIPRTPLLETAKFFSSAAKAVSACNAYLALRAEMCTQEITLNIFGHLQLQDTLPVSTIQISKIALSTVMQMLTQLSSDAETVVDVEKNVNKTSSDYHHVDGSMSHSNESKLLTPSTDGDDVKECATINPTNCQFSACGNGRGLTRCAFGYAAGVTGGLKGISYVVTNNEDNHRKPSLGSLRYGVNQGGQANGGVWITFARSFEITLTDLLWIRSGTTIDGRGFNVTITGKCIVLCGVSNVILHNFQVSTVGESDTVHIYAGSSRIWVDHLTSTDAKLGLVSVLQGSTDVTISNSYLSNYNFNMLLGASDFDKEDAGMRVSVYRNWFQNSMQRMPHCRWGKCHVMNNLYTNWGYYALGARVGGKIYSESNLFVASRRSEITHWFNGIGTNYDNSIFIKSTKDIFLNGSTLHEFLNPNTTESSDDLNTIYKSDKLYPPAILPATLNKVLPNCVGAVFGQRLLQCST